MSRPVIVFRTNGGASVGLGHLRRCLSLGQELNKKGGLIKFLVNADPSAVEILHEHGFETTAVDRNDDHDLCQTWKYVGHWSADALVVDSYLVRGEALNQVGKCTVAVIDDLADRPLTVDLVINGAANAWELIYRTSPRTRLLLGPDYILLREEFSLDPKRGMRDHIGRVLITLGGMDKFDLTPQVIEWARESLGWTVIIDVVIGPFFSQNCIAQVERMARADTSIRVYWDPANIRELMLTCDLAIAGGGQTTYELAATGTPVLAIRLADNQTGNLNGLSAKGTLMWVGDGKDRDLEQKVAKALVDLSSDVERRKGMSVSGRVAVDGCGTRRVTQAILEACGR